MRSKMDKRFFDSYILMAPSKKTKINLTWTDSILYNGKPSGELGFRDLTEIISVLLLTTRAILIRYMIDVNRS